MTNQQTDKINNIVTSTGSYYYDRLHFSEAAIHNGVMYCSGVIGSNEKGKIPDSITDEFRNAWATIGKLLAHAGAGYGDILEYTTYHVGLQAHMAEFMSVRDEFLQEPWAAWTAIGITELAAPGAHVEIRVHARVAG